MEQKVQVTHLDLDTELRLMKPGGSRYILNCRVGTGATGNSGTVENVQGNVLIPYIDLPDGANQVVGHYEDEAGHAAIYCLWNSEGDHQIVQYLSDSNSLEKIFQWSGLNFQPNIYITGFAKIDNLFYFADGVNELRRINIERAKSGEYEPLKAVGDKHFLNVLVPPPMLPLTVVRQKDVAFGQNYIKDLSLQFAYRYRYADNEITVLSPSSILLPLSRFGVADDEEKNRVKLTIPANEIPGKLVKEIEFLFREGNTGKWKVFKTEKRVGSSSFPVDYYFYNNQNSFAIDDAVAAKPNEGVPINPATLEIADNRLFVGNYKEGYDRPSVNLSATVVAAELENPTNFDLTGFSVYKIRVQGDSCSEVAPGDWQCTAFDTVDGYVVGNGTDYYNASYDTGFDAVVFNSSATPLTAADFNYTQSATPPDPSFNTYSLVAGTGSETIIASNGSGANPLNLFKIFKSETAYQVGVLFKDYGGRNAGVADGIASVFIPKLSSDLTDIQAQIEWELLSVDAAAEIPEWATHYHIVRTRNQSKTVFLQGMTADITYATKSGAEENNMYSYVYDANHACVLIDISTLGLQNLGYIYTKGDRVKLFGVNGNDYDFEILGQYGKFLQVRLTNLGTIAAGGFNYLHNYKFEIYTPYKPATEEIFFEVGVAYIVTDAGLPSRNYSTTSGILKGDCYLVNRRYPQYGGSYSLSGGTGDLGFAGASFYAEAGSPNDKSYSVWDTDAGRATVRLVNGEQTVKPNGLRFSNKYIQGTQINGLSEFEALNETLLPVEDGKLRHLLAVGNSLMAFQEQATTPLPIGEAQISDTVGQTLISLSEKIIGKGRKVPYGTQHPESVKENNGIVYWYDSRSASVLRWAGEVQVISDLGLRSYFRKVSRAYVLGYLDHAHALYDPQANEYVLTTNTNSGEVEETVGFSELDKQWKSFYTVPAKGCKIGTTLLHFFSAQVWATRMQNVDDSQFNMFFGVEYPSIVQPVINQEPDTVKIFQYLKESADKVWHCEIMTTQEGQRSSLLPVDFETVEGQHQAEIMRDENTPNTDYPLFEGDEMRSTALELRLTNTSTAHTKLFTVTVGYAKS